MEEFGVGGDDSTRIAGGGEMCRQSPVEEGGVTV